MSLELAVPGLLASLEGHALRLGVFERVNMHEPKAAPDAGIWCAIWAQNIGGRGEHSGLAETAALLTMNARIGMPMLTEPQDYIDPAMLVATARFMGALTRDFQLSDANGEPQCKAIDLLGMTGQSLSSQGGYLSQDGKMFRVMTILIPIIVNDAWEQVP